MDPDLAARLKALRGDRFAAVVVIGFVAVICWAWWAFSARPDAAAVPLDATIRWIGPSDSRTANLRGAPQMVLEVETADGRHLRLASDARFVWHCRVGGQIHLAMYRTNVGALSYGLGPRPCDA